MSLGLAGVFFTTFTTWEAQEVPSGTSLCCTSEFQPQGCGCFEWNNYLLWRAVLYIEGCGATSLASTH